MKKTTREWVRKAEADLRGARNLSRKTPPLHDLVCFHCQQGGEKYLKGLLEELGLMVPKTHDLEQLRVKLHPHHPSLLSLRRGLGFLTNFAIATRYPGDNATKRQATSALRWAERVRALVRALLGIPPRPLRRKK
jgi:HEPN domain-containing protein